MAKRADQKKDREIRLSETQMRHPGMEIGAVRQSSPAGEKADLAEEYGYVIRDLKRIAIIALVMLVVLVGLALIL